MREEEMRCQMPDCPEVLTVQLHGEEPTLDDAVARIQACDQAGWQALSMPGTIATFCPDHHQNTGRPNR